MNPFLPQAPESNVRTFKKADRFINLSIPRNDGTSCKLDSVKLYSDNPDHAQLIAALDGGLLTVADLVGSMVFDYRSAAKNASGLVLKQTPVAQAQ